MNASLCMHAAHTDGPKVVELTTKDIREAAAVLGRGMRDNPLHVRALGSDPDARQRALTGMFASYLEQILTKGFVLGASSSRTLVGVCAMVEPGRCQPSAGEKLRLLPGLFRGGSILSTARVLSWVGRWARHDPSCEHWHLGPVGVDRDLQGRGVGTAMLEVFCSRMDQSRSIAYLETDKSENVGFYERFGFRVSAQDAVLGVPNWFMIRDSHERVEQD